jgi:hypothetical protein
METARRGKRQIGEDGKREPLAPVLVGEGGGVLVYDSPL